METDYRHLSSIMSSAKVPNDFAATGVLVHRQPTHWTPERVGLALITLVLFAIGLRAAGDAVAASHAGLGYLVIGTWAGAVIGFMTLAASPRSAGQPVHRSIEDSIIPEGARGADGRSPIEIITDLERMRERGQGNLPEWVRYMAELEASAPMLIAKARTQAAHYNWSSCGEELLQLDRARRRIELHITEKVPEIPTEIVALKSRYRTHLEQKAPELFVLAAWQLRDESRSSENAW